MNTHGALSAAAFTVLSAAAFPAAAPRTAMAEPPVLSHPVDCRLGEDCWLVILYDHDPGPGVKDYACGVQAYDGHDAVDIAVRDYAVMYKGVNVLAAADGVTAGVRDGEADFAHLKNGPQAVKGKECGNGARIVHGGGWETQYCHMLKGGMAVKKGQRVRRGDVIGKIGMSGETTFPHVHFSVQKDGKKIDPFLDPGSGAGACKMGADTLWAADDPIRAAYSFGPLYAVGFAQRGIEFSEIKNGHHRKTEFSADAPALVLYAAAYWTKPGDVWALTITGPDGKPVHESTQPVKQGKAHAFIFTGRKRPGAAWAPGIYTGEVTLSRGTGRLTLRQEITVK